MDLDQFERACRLTAELLMREGTMVTAERCPGLESSPNHLMWMLLQALSLYESGKVEKANRWLGFVQGSMAADGYATVEELKHANMAEGETFDGNRV